MVRRTVWPLAAVLAIPVMAGSIPASAAEATAPLAVEGFSYPGAAQILAEQHITLKSGDGNIQLADCTSTENLLEVFSRTLNTGPAKVCFRVTGPVGYLALELPKVYSIKGDDHAVKATLNTDGSVSSFDVRKNYYTPVGEGASAEGTTLLELSATDGPAAPAATSEYPAVGALNIGQPGRTGARACTATLVDPYWVLSAAGCFTDNPATLTAGAPATKSTVTIGGKSAAVVELVPRTDRDLVMARLEVPATGVTPMPVATTAPVAGQDLTAAGYGRTKTAWVPGKLHTSVFTVAAVAATGTDIVAKAPADTICQGDAGGPAIRKTDTGYELAAVNSRAWQGGCLGTPASETRTGAAGTRVDDIALWITRTANSTPSGTVTTGSPFTIVDPADGHLVTYLRDSNSQLWSVDPQGEGWKNWGAYAAADPVAVVNPANNHVIVYVNGPDNRLWSFDERANENQRWTKFDKTSSNTVLAPGSVPSTVVDPADGHLVTYIRDTASHLWSVDPQGEGWSDFGAMAATSPTAIAANGHVVVYVNGPNNLLYSVDQRGNGWTTFVETPSHTVLAPNAVPHTVIDPADGHLVTYIRDTASHLWSVDPQGEGWVDFGAMAATDPTTIASPSGQHHLITYVNGPDNRLFMVDPLGVGWTIFDKTPDDTALAADTVPHTVVDPADNHLVTFVRDTRNVLWAVDPQGEGWTKYHGGPSAP
ncbi:trypsin-like serine protease [Kitasatospora sp. NPDC092286]|uniref:trypsin-like serine protease n=1 Tax=Kitasatospora sp. NPDC092286 TaxID=3364087 RepID=UPI00381AA88D